MNEPLNLFLHREPFAALEIARSVPSTAQALIRELQRSVYQSSLAPSLLKPSGVEDHDISRLGWIVLGGMLVVALAHDRPDKAWSPQPVDATFNEQASELIVTDAAGLHLRRRADVLRELEPQRDGNSVDLLGNEVVRAVATYEVDNTGSLVELHSPHTKVPLPGVPKS
jgi:hypothetical protein